ncbi:unnamed protein product [Linum tenue]|uniref:GDSL esterase/lipase n=1 Tax=Linum tenue TaxID=586396 RepID=A0AAV0PDI9_9ROSI|nr:unnamed protein product [Linum tenue]
MVMVMMIGSAEATMPAVFVLGDSTVDVGTNNFLTGSVDRADFPHNGIDFPGSKATGRFSNGHNIADFLGLEMSPPPFFALGNGTAPLKNSSFKGVNFASGGSGILDTTGLSPNLLKLGARKFGIATVAPIGCCPSQRLFNRTLGCLEELNDLALAFHPRVTQLMYKLSSEYHDMKFSIGNAFLMTINVINHPNRFGFKDGGGACCGQGALNAQAPCTPTASLCPIRDDYLFWDLFHPTQKAAQLAAVTLYSGPPFFVAPINFKQLAEA